MTFARKVRLIALSLLLLILIALLFSYGKGRQPAKTRTIFHADSAEAVAKEAGRDLSTAFTDDVDGNSRVEDWDIGVAEDGSIAGGELLVKIGNGGGYEDGDIIHAFSSKRILNVHAQHICHPKRFGKNAQGLREPDTLLQNYLENTKGYKFARISEKAIKRTSLVTGAEDIISNVPNAKGEYMDVPLYIKRRLKHERHLIFGTRGNEYWYGGETIVTNERLDKIWEQIEKKTAYKKKGHTSFPFTPRELKQFRVIKVDKLSDDAAAELAAPKLGPPDVKGERAVLKQRRYRIDYKNLPGLSAEEKISITEKEE